MNNDDNDDNDDNYNCVTFRIEIKKRYDWKEKFDKKKVYSISIIRTCSNIY